MQKKTRKNTSKTRKTNLALNGKKPQTAAHQKTYERVVRPPPKNVNVNHEPAPEKGVGIKLSVNQFCYLQR